MLTIGEVAKRSGVSVPTLRFYEEKQLIQSIRTNGNQRRYLRGVLRRVAIIKVAQKVGISLAEIQEGFKVLPKDHNPTKADWEQLSKAWQIKLDERISLLMQMKEQMQWCIGCGCLSLEDCPLRNPNDVMAQKKRL